MRSLHFKLGIVLTAMFLTACASTKPAPTGNQYADYVWPPPPDQARIQLVDILHGRADVEGDSKLARALIGVDPSGALDRLRKPFGVEIDAQGRILVTDTEMAALFRFDRAQGVYDIFGKTGSIKLVQPTGLDLHEDGSIFVADATLKKVVRYSSEGDVLAVFGQRGDLSNPTDVAVNPAGDQVFVADSKGQRIVVFDISSGKIANSFGNRGNDSGRFSFPSALTFGPEGNLWVVDQMNSRVQIFAENGEYFDEFGELRAGFGGFVRPKSIDISTDGLVFVTDAAFNNVQIFDIDLQLLTFVGAIGQGPGLFRNPSGVAVRDGWFAMVDQLNRRVQVFRFIDPSIGE